MKATTRLDANNHQIPGLHGFFLEKTVEYDAEAVSAQAALTINPAGANNSLVFTALPYGILGNNISVRYVDPGGATATLGVVVTQDGDDYLITVNLGRAASAINTTGDLLKAAIQASDDAAALVTVADDGADDGSGLVTTMAVAPLVGGSGNTLFTVVGDVLYTLLATVKDGDFTGDGSISVGTAYDDEGIIQPEPVATDLLDKLSCYQAGNWNIGDPVFAGLNTAPADQDIRDKVTVDTVTGILKYVLFWYPLSDNANIEVG